MPAATGHPALGDELVVYRPEPLWKIAWRFSLTATAAAALWTFADRIDIKYVDFLIAFFALVPTFWAFALGLRLLRPAKTIALYEDGIVVGKHALAWDDIEKVEYHREEGTQWTGRSFCHHDFTFVLGEGKKRSLILDDAPLRSHVDVSAFLDHLYVNSELVDLADPTVRREEGPPGGAARDPVLAERLQELLRGIVAEPPRGSISPEIEQALEHGLRRRTRLAWSSTLLGLLLIPLGLISRLATFLLVATGFFSGLWLVVELLGALVTFDFTEALDQLGNLRLPTIAIVFASSWWLGKKTGTLTEDTDRESARLRALSSGFRGEEDRATAQELHFVLERGDPFALYLRSFQDEFFQYLEAGVPHVRELFELPEYEGVARQFDIDLIEYLTDSMTVFGLANAADASASRRLKRLFVEDDRWFDTVRELSREASAIVVHLSSVTESLMAELDLLDRTDRRGKTLLIRGDQFSEESLTEQERSRIAAFPCQIEEDALSSGGPVLEFVASLESDETRGRLEPGLGGGQARTR